MSTESMVTQADRDAASKAVIEATDLTLDIRMGDADHLAVVQAFARHRTAAQPERDAVLPPFTEAWVKKEADGYRYGSYALENVEFGYRMACDELAALTTPAPPSEREAVLEQLRAEFQRWLDKGPDEQPHYPSGTRPFSTGDLKAFVAALTTPAPACGHDWQYTRTDYHGSHKGEKHYRCRKCRSWKYELDGYVTSLVERPADTEAAPAVSTDGGGELVDWLHGQKNLSLYFYRPIYGDDDDQAEEWRVDELTGNINDREWTTVGRGATPSEALESARATLTRLGDAT